MWRYAGIERTAKGLEHARRSIDFWRQHQGAARFRDPGWQLQNMLLTGELMVLAAAERSVSVGTHQRIDSPENATVDPQHHGFIRPNSKP